MRCQECVVSQFWRHSILAPHPPHYIRHLLPREKAFYRKSNALLRRGELCSPEFNNNIKTTNGRTQFAPTVVWWYTNLKQKKRPHKMCGLCGSPCWTWTNDNYAVRCPEFLFALSSNAPKFRPLPSSFCSLHPPPAAVANEPINSPAVNLVVNSQI